MSHHQRPAVPEVVLEPLDDGSARPSVLQQLAALGLVAGPVAFVAAWATAGVATEGYSAVQQAISELAAVDAPHRSIVTLGLVAYGAYLLAAVPLLRRSAIGACWPAVAVNALATWAVAALPLHRSDLVDLAHGVAATVGYVSLAAAPALAVAPLTRTGRSAAGTASALAAAAIAMALSASTWVDANGLAQRVGLGIGDLWLVAVGLSLAGGRLGPTPPQRD
ncbi:MAG: DUF998 domain-containing protein [Acidimicrobiales bacterium]